MPASSAKKKKNAVAVTHRPLWQRPTSGLAATKASLQRPDLEQLRSGPGEEWVWDMRGGAREVTAKYATIRQPAWNSRVK